MTVAPLPDTVFDGVIDVSHHNGAIDWPSVAAAGIALVFIKATQGSGFVDPAFAHNRTAALAAGLMVVPYHFIDSSDPAAQATHFLQVTDLAAGQPAMLDWETAAPLATVAVLGEAITGRTGRDPVAYYGCAQLPQANPDLSRWPLMLPEYPRGNTSGTYRSLVTQPPRLPPGRPASWNAGQRPYHFHQYTPAGRIPGIATPVDRSVWTAPAAALQTWYAAPA